MGDVDELLGSWTGVVARTDRGLKVWRYHGRLVARQLDDDTLVIRSSFPARDTLLQAHPETFCVPRQFSRHMMIVADLRTGDEDAIEAALAAAHDLQSAAG